LLGFKDFKQKKERGLSDGGGLLFSFLRARDSEDMLQELLVKISTFTRARSH
jgi:hypothetical protein